VRQSLLNINGLRRLEAIQNRTIMIISGAKDYTNFTVRCISWNKSLDTLTQNVYTKILQKSDCLHKLLPGRELEYVNKLWTLRAFTFLP